MTASRSWHAGRVLAVGAPLGLVKSAAAIRSEDTFVGYLAEAAEIDRSKRGRGCAGRGRVEVEADPLTPPKRFELARLWART